MTHKMLSQNNKKTARKTTIILLLLLTIAQTPQANAEIPSPIIRTELTINLEEGVSTEAEITYPSIGDGPFPVVLLVPGGGLTDMDEYIPASVSATGKPAAEMKQIAEYLSERGFMVLRYDKRGIIRNATMVDYDLYSRATVETFKADAEKALQVLKENPMADTSDITLIGHSESSLIVPRIALDDPTVTKIVMMGGAARDYLSIKRTQIIDLRLVFVETVLDKDGDGVVSLSEAIEGMEPYENSILPKSSLLMNTGNMTTWVPTWDPNGDGVMNITSEFEPILERLHSLLSNPAYPGYNQTMAQVSWVATMDMIGELQSSILILQGEGDWQTPPIEAILLEQVLADANQRDHTLYMYPGLSHFFYPTDGWQAAMGPIEPYVLRDLYEWLVSPMRSLDQVMEENQDVLEEMQRLGDQIEADVDSVSQFMNESIMALENELTQPKWTDYMIPVLTVLLVVLIVASKKRGES